MSRTGSSENVDAAVVRDFGKEWQRYDQRGFGDAEARRQFDAYFAVFPWSRVAPDAIGMDVGCGSGRWAAFVAPRVGKLHCIDPSDAALAVAKRNLASFPNCEYHVADTSQIPLPNASCDFGYSLGVLHHIPDVSKALRDCVTKLKPGAPFLVYLYYRFDNRPAWFRALWSASDILRRLIARLPFGAKLLVTQVLALLVYWPLARAALLARRLGLNVDHWPLAQYSGNSFYTMRTDALDRFGTRLEHRFTRPEIVAMMTEAGLTDIRFSDLEPYWCAIGVRSGA
jgi:ubiquinone/menaquinone biosynthesis C-methylase UbiE